jgi:hypothetical protein
MGQLDPVSSGFDQFFCLLIGLTENMMSLGIPWFESSLLLLSVHPKMAALARLEHIFLKLSLTPVKAIL